jgi:hypothetical protein
MKIGSRPTELIAEAFIPDNELKELSDFCGSKKAIYLYGSGKIGTGMALFLRNCGIEYAGFITSEMFSDWYKNYVAHCTGIIISVDNNYIPEIELNIRSLLEDDVYLPSLGLRHFLARKGSEEFVKNNLFVSLNIVGGCNLNCKSCKTFSPLAENNDIYELIEIENDVSRLKNLGVKLRGIMVQGGEPLLHPELLSVLMLCRREFPLTNIELITNGILLRTFSDSMWQKLRKLGITLLLSDYALGGGYFLSNCETAEKQGVNYMTLSHTENVNSDNHDKMFVKWTLNFEKTAPAYNFYNCKKLCGETTLFLRKGRLYPCSVITFVNNFCKYFNKALQLTRDDYLEISHISDKDIYSFLVKRPNFCGYCDIEKNELVPWGLSERDIAEWT